MAKREPQPELPFAPSGASAFVSHAARGGEPCPATTRPPSAAAAVPDVLGVAELDRRLKRLLETKTAGVRVLGEVGGLTRSASGHCYFSLKDEREDAMVDCVLFRGAAPPRAQRLLIEGERVVCAGRVSLFAPRGRLQLVVDALEAAGRGALLEALEALKRRLAEEGLFDPGRKRPLPNDPKVVAVVTSRDGAAIHDVARVAFRRGRVRLLLVPSPVQGAGAAARIAEAIDNAGRLAGVDAVLVTRGGGSAEDLSCFNDELVVRAIARCPLPVVSAVGHEIDTTLADLAADARAATPSQAAELLVPEEAERRARLEQLRLRLRRSLQHRMTAARGHLDATRRRLGEPTRLVLEQGQRFDELTARLERAFRRRVAEARARTEDLRRRLGARHPRAVLAANRSALVRLVARLAPAWERRVAALRRALEADAARLDALSPVGVLGRGYALVTTDEGRLVRDASTLNVGEGLSVRVARGEVHARVDRPPR